MNLARIIMALSVMALSVSALGGPVLSQTGEIPVAVTLPRAGLATVVIDDAQGNRVRNLISETPLPAGKTMLAWDGCDDGPRVEKAGALSGPAGSRRRVPPGVYHVRGLVHDRLRMRYQFSVNSPGTPPWKTADGSGGWLADHTPPSDILALPGAISAAGGKGPASFLVCSSSAETGEEFVWLNAEGRRLYGMNTGFWGGTHLARDRGAKPDPDYYAYVLESGERDPDNNHLEVRGFTPAGNLVSVCTREFPLALKKTTLPPFQGEEAYGTDGLAAYDGAVIISFTRLHKLVFADARKKRALGEVTLPYAPRGIVADAQGHLYVIAEHSVRRYTLKPGQARLGEERTLISSGLDDPRRISLDESGHIYISDWGRSHQVKVFSTEGRFRRAIGKPGGPQLGLYDDQRMSFPAGTAVDQNGQLWVAEAEQYPKRLSLWRTAGAFLKAWYGGPKYGGGGTIDPADPSRFYYVEWGADNGGVEFALDWVKGTGKPEAIYWRPRMLPGVEPMMGHAPERAFVIGGHRYLVNSLNGPDRWNNDRGCGLWRLDADHIARPAAMVGDAADLNNGQWGWPIKNKDAINALWAGKDPGRVLFVWSDRNGDGIAQPSEVQWILSEKKDAQGAFLEDVGLQPSVQPDLSITTSFGVTIPPPRIDARGRLQYDLSKIRTVGDPAHLRSTLIGGDWTISQQDGDAGIFGASADGKRLWQYPAVPSEGSSAHVSPGEVLEPNRPLGPAVKPPVGEAGYLTAINGDTGCTYLFTLDGLFLQTLGGDDRSTSLWRFPVATRGMTIDGVTFSAEEFDPTLTQTSEGTLWLVVGHEHSSIVRLDGLETVKRLDLGNVTLSADRLAGLPARPSEVAQATTRKTLTVPLLAATPRGDRSAWPAGAPWASLDERASASVVVSGDRLYAAYRTGDPHALSSGGGDIHTLFKSGGALDLMLGTDPHADAQRHSPVAGDERLLVTQAGGRTLAVLYRPVVPGSPVGAAYEYQSPIGRVDFDAVSDISDQVKLIADGQGGFRFSVPLTVLGLSVRPGDAILGDLGLLRGDARQTIQRLYWNNQKAKIVSDVPSEARLAPGNWGVFSIGLGAENGQR